MKFKHIYLTGFMGAGKSKIGPLLAENLGLVFYDSDHLIEEKAQKKILEIFEDEGEGYFRDLESQTISCLAAMENPAVIALGGGALIRKANMSLIQQTGISVYISSSPEAIYSRISHSSKRPLLKVPSGTEKEHFLLSRIRELLSEREGLYKQADIILDRDQLPLEEIVRKLTTQIKSKKGKPD
jgi:shikimate kinase